MGPQADDDVQPQAEHRTPADRARALVAAMTLEEKLALVHQVSPGIPRLGLAPFRTGTEALHGVSWLGTATVFPQPVGLAATWDPELVRRVGEAVATEVRAKHAADPSVSLNVWAPVVNPLRNPLWGRNEEGFSEDPCLTAQIATAYARGLRGEHPVFWKTVPTLKHFLAYNNEADRAVTSSQMRPRVLHEYELPAYRGPIAAGVVGAVMPSYNLVNGRPNHVAQELLEELRSWTPDSLLVVSDAGAPTNLVDAERYFTSHTESHAASLRAGVDSFTDHDADAGPTTARLTAALEAGLLTEDDVDRAVRRQIELRLRTGELDPARDPYAGIGADALDLPEHRDLAREATARGVVLLANDGVLPLLRDAGASAGATGAAAAAPRVAVVGPLAERVLHDWYSGTPPYLHGLGSALGARLGAGQVEVVEGADQVALYSRSARAYLAVTPTGPEQETVLVADSPTASPDTHLDLTDWGEGVVTLRSVATGALLTGASWIIGAGASRVGGWVAQETFRLHRHEDGTWSLKHVASGRWLRVQAGSGLLVAEATTLGEAEHLELRTLRSGEVEVARAAAAADVVVVVVGNDPHVLGRETQDRPGLDLPRQSQALWRAAVEANPRAVLTIVSSYPYALAGIADHAAAVVWSCHAGQELGPGLADVLVGDAEPTGRLAQTWVADAAHAGDLLDYDIIAARTTYWYSPHEPLYPFGHGLMYTEVAYADVALSHEQVGAGALTNTVDAGRPTVTVSVTVTNTGGRRAHETTQLYVCPLDAPDDAPLRRLAGHTQVSLAAGESARVGVDLDLAALATWDVRAGALRVRPGRYRVAVGSSSTALGQEAVLEVTGPPRAAVRAHGTTLRAVDYDRVTHVVIAEETPLTGEVLQVAPGCHTGWVELDDLDLDGTHEVVLRVARVRPGVASLSIDGADGGRTARIELRGDGGRYDWYDVRVPLTGADRLPGPLRLTLTGAARLSTLTFA